MMRDEDDLRAALRTLESRAPDPETVLRAVGAGPKVRGRASGRGRGGGGTGGRIGARRQRGRLGPGRADPGRSAARTRGGFPVVHGRRAAGLFPGSSGLRHRRPARQRKRIRQRADPGQIPPTRDGAGRGDAPGKVAATATLPGYVTAIASSNGAFFAAVVAHHAARFYAISLDAGSLDGGAARATVTELPIQPDTAPIEYLAASPEGRALAYATMVRRGPFADVLPAPAGQQSGCNDDPIWVSDSGRMVLLDCYRHRAGTGLASPGTVTVVLIDGGHVTKLPWLAATGHEVTAFPGITALGANPDYPQPSS
jgi:hypothetical protein